MAFVSNTLSCTTYQNLFIYFLARECTTTQKRHYVSLIVVAWTC